LSSNIDIGFKKVILVSKIDIGRSPIDCMWFFKFEYFVRSTNLIESLLFSKSTINLLQELTDKVALEMSKVLQQRIQTLLPDIFFRTVIPAFERSCQSMFQQLASTYHRGMDESKRFWT